MSAAGAAAPGAAAPAGPADPAAPAAGAAPGDAAPLLVAAHVAFIAALDSKRDSFDHVATEHLRMSGVYWGLSAVTIAGARDALDSAALLRFVASCECAGGGYAGAPGHDAHLLYTLSALQLLALLGAAPPREHADATRAFVRGLQRPDGSIAGDRWGEVDSRFSYCALQAAALLGGGLEATLDVRAAVRFVAACRNFDGGFGAVPGAESHAGQVFCAVGALAIAGALADVVDADLLGWWLAERQCDSGGLNGRPEKQADVCYSWWILSALELLGRAHWVDARALARFVRAAQDDSAGGGGFADRAGNTPDVFHTFFGLAALSLLGDLDGLPGHERIDAAYALPRSVVERLGLPCAPLPRAPAYA